MMQQQLDDVGQQIEQQRLELEHLRLQQARPLFTIPGIKICSEFFCCRPAENVDLFIDRFNRQCQANNYADYQKHLILPSLLREAAEVIYQNIPPAEKQAMNYDALVQLLRMRFSPTHACELKNVELQTRIQRQGEMVTEYAVSIQQLVHEAFPELDNDTRD
uniref:Retrotransposon gag domain-containing protein n=1 Tax=Romanomermis culicivorax TaxID=13658 RepID=A0A915LA07_ROMCU